MCFLVFLWPKKSPPRQREALSLFVGSYSGFASSAACSPASPAPPSIFFFNSASTPRSPRVDFSTLLCTFFTALRALSVSVRHYRGSGGPGVATRFVYLDADDERAFAARQRCRRRSHVRARAPSRYDLYGFVAARFLFVH